jgi:hypothetical protein
MVKAEDLIKEQQEKIEIRKKCYKKVYKRIENKIVQVNSVNESQCWYEIPEFILGIPLYSFDDCKKYIIEKLKKNGFKTTMINDNVILIDWSK